MTQLSRSVRHAMVAISVLCGALCALTLAVPDWIEALGFEPDGGDGTVEAMLPIGFGLGMLVFALATWLDSRRARRAATAGVE
jgi:TRAP-type C4-dicarboxylate transport system permease small subunit